MTSSASSRRRRRSVPYSRVREWTKNVVLIDWQGDDCQQPLPLYDYMKLFDGLIKLSSNMTELDVREEIVRLIKLKNIVTHRLDNIKPESFDFVKVYNRRVRPLDGDVPFDATGLAHIYKNGNIYVRLNDSSLWTAEQVTHTRPVILNIYSLLLHRHSRLSQKKWYHLPHLRL